jgi:hypothetical protein
MTMTIKEAIRRYGLESLRGRPIPTDGEPLYISDSSLDETIELWANEPENAYLTRRFYGAEVLNGDRVRWIYSSSLVDLAIP